MVDISDIKLALSFDDVLLVPKYSKISSRAEVTLSTKLTSDFKLKIPINSINMDDVTGVEMAIKIGKLGGLGLLPRFDTPEVQAAKVSEVANAKVTPAAAVGVKEGYLDRAKLCVRAGAKVITLDIAHGHMQKALDATGALKNEFGNNVVVICGVVATYDGAKRLYEAGADSVRVGLGPGTICTTRVMTGFGVPQVTALLDVSRAAKEFKKTFIADGGMKNSGDIVKALATGASAIICGSLLAGTDEAPGKLVEKDGIKYKEYNASTSRISKEKQLQKEKKGKSTEFVKHVEGVESLVPYKGSVEGVIDNLLAGVRSGLSYAGAKTIPQLWDKAEFIRITNAGMAESRPHDVLVLNQIQPS